MRQMKFFLIIIFSISSIFLSAQDVEGVKIDSVMTYSQVVVKFGKPDKYLQKDGEDLFFDSCEYYTFGNNRFVFYGGRRLRDFYLNDDSFAALTKDIKGGIKVGDNIDKLNGFKYGKPQVAEWMNKSQSGEGNQEGRVIYYLYPNRDDHVFLSVEDGIILSIYYSYLL